MSSNFIRVNHTKLSDIMSDTQNMYFKNPYYHEFQN